MANTPKKNLFSRFSLALTRAFATSVFVRFLSLYRAANERLKTGFFHQIPEFFAAKKGHVLRFKSAFSRLFENSFFVSLFRRLISFFLTMRTRSVGIFFCVLGLSNCLIYLARRFTPLFGAEDAGTLIFGILLTLAAFSMFQRKSSISAACAESRILGKFLSNVIFLRRAQYPREAAHTADAFGLLAGLLAGVLCVFLNPFLLLALLLLPILLAFAVYKPEFGMCLFFFFLPFVSAQVTSIIVLFIFFCLILKLLRGKRSLHIDLLSLVALIFCAFIGIVLLSTNGQNAAPFFSVLSFFIIQNLSRRRKVFENLLSAFVAGQSLFSALRVLFFFLPDHLTNGALRTLEEAIRSNASVALTICAAIVCLYPFLHDKRTGRILFTFFCLAALLVDISLYSSLAATVATAVATVLLLACSSRAMFFLLLALGAGALVALPFIEGQQSAVLINALASRTPSLFFVQSDLPQGAFSLGLGAFSPADLEALGISIPAESLSFYSQLFLGVGIFGAILFFLTIFFAFQKSADYYVNATHNTARLLPVTPVFAILSLLLFGIAQNLLADARILTVMFSLVAVSSAATDTLSQEDSALLGRF